DRPAPRDRPVGSTAEGRIMTQHPTTTPAPQPDHPPAPDLPAPSPADDVLEMEPTIEGEDFSRVAFTQAAVAQIQRLIDRNGPLMFHQSGGCCDGSSPMCYPEGDLITGDADVRMGHVAIPLPDGTTSPLDFWMSREQFAYWRHTHLTIDLVDGRGGGLSLESPAAHCSRGCAHRSPTLHGRTRHDRPFCSPPPARGPVGRRHSAPAERAAADPAGAAAHRPAHASADRPSRPSAGHPAHASPRPA